MKTTLQFSGPGALRSWLTLGAAGLAVAATLACGLTARVFPTPSQAAPGGLIVYVGADGNVYTTDRGGQHTSAITNDANLNPKAGQTGRVYRYPAWAPDGQQIAFMGFNGSGGALVDAGLQIASSDGKKRVEAFRSQDAFPFYLFWSPNSRYVSFLSNEAGGSDLALNLVSAAGGDNQVIDTGQPYYWDWSPDNRTLLIHTGGSAAANDGARLAVLHLDGAVKKQELDLKPAAFLAPAWSPQGDVLALAAQNAAGSDELLLVGPDGAVKRSLAQVDGPVAFAWSPDASSLAYTAPAPTDASSANRRLVLLDPNQPEKAREISQGFIIAFSWSPNSRSLAYFTLESGTPGGSGPNGSRLPGFSRVRNALTQDSQSFQFQLWVADASGGAPRQLSAFRPTEPFLEVFPYFDQYQRSGTLWSLDSTALVIAVADPSGDTSIQVVGVDGSPAVKIAAGDLAFWSWK